MPFPRAKSLDALYEEVSNYDLVLVPDPPLASALNRRLDRPFFGTFATTPRRLAAGRREATEYRSAFLELTGRLDDDWKAIAYAIGNVLQCWEHQGRVDAVLEYDAYADATTEAVVDSMADLRTTSKRLHDYEVVDDRSVAVVAPEQFTRLERSILPDDYDVVDLFTGEPLSLPSFHLFDSPSAIVDALLDTVTADNADDVAVVLDEGSEYSSLVEAAFETHDVPFYGGPGFTDDPDHRAFVRLLRVALRGPDATVADARPLLTRLGTAPDVDYDNERLDACDAAGVQWLVAARDAVEDWTFADALAVYEQRADRSLDAFRTELRRLGLLDSGVTPAAVDDLAFYLDAYDVPVDRDNEGVLLADAKSAGYVDRPVVFYLGLDDEWTHSAPQRPWVDGDAQFQRYIGSFQRLLQSGDKQYYLVQDTAGGQPVTPCLYFHELLDREFDRFSELPSVEHTRIFDDGGSGFGAEQTDVEPEPVERISQSSLNTYVNSPRDYLFSRLVDDPDEDYFREGNLFHDFAEFYVHHPGHVDEEALTDVVDLMLSEVAPFHDDADRALKRREYRIGIETLVEFLDERPPTDGDFLTPASRWGKNVFAAYFDASLDSPVTERWFENDALGIEGKIDLVHAATRLLDYKSGSRKRASQVVEGAAVDPPDDTPNFQAALYLAHYRTVRPDERLEFTFFHFLETLDDVVQGDADVEDTLTTVEYVPTTFDEFVATEEAFDVLLDGYNDCQATFEDLGFERYRKVMADRSFPATTEKSELRDSEFAAEFTEAVDAATGDVDAEKGCDQAIRALNRERRTRFFEDDLDAFEAFVDDVLEDLNAYRAGEGRFPLTTFDRDEPNYRRVDNRDLLLERGASERAEVRDDD